MSEPAPSPIEQIYAAWKGNASDMARDIEELPVTTNQWRYRGNIPPGYWAKIREKAQEVKGVDLPLDLFLQMAEDARKAPAAA